MSLRKFEILEMIAKGGMAEVYRARTVGVEGFAKEVCVKKILPHLTEDEGFVRMFINEAKLAATLSNGNIVSVYDLCVSAEREYFIVMEYVDGKDLAEVIRAAQLAGHPIPPAIAVYIAREVCKGLHYAHTKTDDSGAPVRIIHRDVSPQNVLLSSMGEVKITDFGIAKASSIAHKTAVGVLKGKYGYMSPEQARGEPIDHRSDVFNLGIVLYEMIVAERCFAGASDYSTLNLMREAVVTAPSKVNGSVPPALESIVLKALARWPEDRFQDALELEGQLGAYARDCGHLASATDLNRFLAELFARPDSGGATTSTGVLSLASLVGPAPATDDDRPGEARGQEAELASADRRQSTPPGDRRRSTPPVGAEPTPSDPPDGERASSASDTPAAGPASSSTEDVRSRWHHLRRAREIWSRTRTFGWRHRRPALLLLAIVGLALGAGLGEMRRAGRTPEAMYRSTVSKAREPATPPAVAIVIETEPPGATVWFDGSRLAHRTPLTIERPRDDRSHEIELVLATFRTLRRSVRYDPGPLTAIRHQLDGEPGRLAVDSTPSGLVVRVDGVEVGRTPVRVEVPWGRRRVEIGGGDHEVVAAVTEIVAGEQTRISRSVARKGEDGKLELSSVPDAEIVVDGEPAGPRTSAAVLTLSPNIPHRIALKADGATRELTITLEPGERRRLFVNLLERPRPGSF